MEVHHHHTHNPHRREKKWSHYFWEFLMLFLAVFCGFLAENQREHYVEGHRAKEYAKSLLSDMKEDTTEIANGIRQNRFMLSTFDSCISIGLKNIDNTTVPGTFYYWIIAANNETDNLIRNQIIGIRSRLLAVKHFRAFAFLDISKVMKGHIKDTVADSLVLQQLPLKTGSTGLMEEFLNTLLDRKWRNTRFVEELYPGAQKLAGEIINMLKSEYHLK